MTPLPAPSSFGSQCMKTGSVVTIQSGTITGGVFTPTGTPTSWTDGCSGTAYTTYSCATTTSSSVSVAPLSCGAGCTGCPGGCISSVCMI
ncbi:hypothetical protein EXS73_02230 [Candidatus Pacearchaeota archaeon]|nr:hypothetical protein [Candidatus Pacearchaeota archaeon]